MEKKRVVIGVAIVAGAVVLAAALRVWLRPAPDADASVLILNGNVDIRQVSLAFNATERIAELRVKEGDHVAAGQVLGTLDMRTARLRVAQAQAQIGVQEQALGRLRAGSRPQEISQARANVAAAEADADLAVHQIARLQGVRDATMGRGVSQQDLDAALARQKVAAAQLDAIRSSAQIVIAGPRKEDIAQAQSQLEVTRTEQALLKQQLAEAELKAPIDSTVRARLLEPGDMASPQRPVFTLAITRPKWVRAYVPEPRLGQIHPGMPASVSTDSAPAKGIAGSVGYISSVAEFTPKTVQTEDLRTSLVYEVRILVDDRDDTLRLGMPATVRIAVDPSRKPKPP